MENGELVAPLPDRVTPEASQPAASERVADRLPSPQAAGEPRAMTTAQIVAHSEAVLGYCARMVRDPVLAEDLMQKVFVEAVRDFETFQGRSSLRTWLFGIATFRCLDALRKRQRESTRFESNDEAVAGFEDPGLRPDGQVDKTQLLAALDSCLIRLSADVRAAVLLRFQRELTYEEMAPLLDASAEALQMRVTRALPRLRKCLQDKGWTGE